MANIRRIELNESELEYVRSLRVGERFKIYGFVEARVVPIHADSLTKHCSQCVAGNCVRPDRNQCPLLQACVAHRRKDGQSVYFERV